jgi:ATP-dependent helicase/nuclease subunit A
MLAADAVRVMSIHAAKGLEFPFVFLAGAGTEFGPRRGPGPLVCDPELGLGLEFYDARARRPRITPARPDLEAKRRRRELEEELRLLYVAATRAKEMFIAVGHVEAQRLDGLMTRPEAGPSSLLSVLSVRSTLEWLLLGFAGPGVNPQVGPAGEIVEPSSAGASATAPSADAVDARWLDESLRLLRAQPDLRGAQSPAALSVSRLKQAVAEHDVDAGGLARIRMPRPRLGRSAARADGVEIGRAYHRVLELAAPEKLLYPLAAQAEVARLADEGRITREQAACVNADDLAWFCGTPEGQGALRAAALRRETPFVCAAPGVAGLPPPILRGVIDCLFEEAEGLTLLDFKTDLPRDAEDWRRRLAGYQTQLQIYAQVAARLFGCPVHRAALVFVRARRIERVRLGESLEQLLRDGAARDRGMRMAWDEAE